VRAKSPDLSEIASRRATLLGLMHPETCDGPKAGK
jgi:hypothetical protein